MFTGTITYRGRQVDVDFEVDGTAGHIECIHSVWSDNGPMDHLIERLTKREQAIIFSELEAAALGSC